ASARATSRHSSRRSSASRPGAATSEPASRTYGHKCGKEDDVAHYRQVGEVPAKRHTQFRRPDGGLYSEELMGEEGFSSDSSLLYHRGMPSALVDVLTWALRVL